jgi:CheY-like chemotaxis protein
MRQRLPGRIGLNRLMDRFGTICAAQVCTALRSAGVKIPIIAMTGNVDPTSIAVFHSCGFDGLLAKPFTQVMTFVTLRIFV